MRLHKDSSLNVSYGPVKNALKESGFTDDYSANDIASVIKTIRNSKLPDYRVLGNNGSFFKNPIINKDEFDQLLIKHPNIVAFDTDNGGKKIPAGWLIEHAGWKGLKRGNVGVYEKHALVIVNHGGATGEEIYNFISDIIKDINEKFGILLEPESEIV